jgi:hypothetical protein
MESFLTIWLPILLGIIAIALLIIGLRGRRIDDHPLCGRCGFDLFGKPLDSRICPECGSPVSKWDVRIGHRERRGGLIFLALVLLAPAALWAAVVGTLAFRGVDFIRIKPVTWLLNDAESNSSFRQHDAFAELGRRCSAGELTPAQLDRILDRALTVQGERHITPDHVLVESPSYGQWIEFIEAARAAGKVSDARWQRYAEQSVVFMFSARPHVRRGDVIPFWLGQWQRCAKSWFAPNYTVALEIDGQPVQFVPTNYPDAKYLPRAYEETHLAWFIDPSDPVYQKLADGEHEAKAFITVTMPGRGAKNPLPPVSVSKKQIASAKFVLQPADRSSVQMDSDPNLKPQIEQWLHRQSLRQSASDHSGDLELVLVPDFSQKLPIDLAFQVAIRADGKDWPCLLPVCFQGQFGSMGIALAKVKDLHAKTADVILKSDPAAAARTLNIERIWDGEITLKDVPIEPWQ